MACNEAGSGVLWILETARSGGRVVVSTNNVVQLKTQWKTRCVGERAKAVEKRARDGGRTFAVGQLVWVRWPTW